MSIVLLRLGGKGFIRMDCINDLAMSTIIVRLLRVSKNEMRAQRQKKKEKKKSKIEQNEDNETEWQKEEILTPANMYKISKQIQTLQDEF